MDNTLFDKTFRDAEGNIVIAQKPNLPILVWFGATVIKFFVSNGNLYIALDWVSLGAILIWSLLELFQGVNYFRRFLGLSVLLVVLGSRFLG